MPIRFSELDRKIINGVGVLNQTFQASPIPAGGQVAVGALTATTRFTIAHGLNYKPSLSAVAVKSMAQDDDTTAATGYTVVKADSTNVTLKPSITTTAANVNFLLIIDLDTDVGGRNSAVG